MIGARNKVQLTPSEHGGVVNDPSYRQKSVTYVPINAVKFKLIVTVSLTDRKRCDVLVYRSHSAVVALAVGYLAAASLVVPFGTLSMNMPSTANLPVDG